MAKYVSINALINDFEKKHLGAINSTSAKMKQLYKEVMAKDHDIGVTGAMVNSLVVENLDRDGFDLTLKDNVGSHTSWWGQENIGVKPGDDVYVPHWVNAGHTKNSSGRGFYEDAVKKINDRFVKVYIREMQKRGINLK